MKNNILTKTFCFLENHIALILGLFFPVWLGILIALGVVLNLLPFEISHRLTLRLMHVPFVILGSLVIIAIIAILRMVRDVRDRKPKQIFLYMFLIALDLIFMSLFFVWFGAVQLKQDNAYSRFEIRDRFDVMLAVSCFNWREVNQTKKSDMKMRSSAIRNR